MNRLVTSLVTVALLLPTHAVQATDAAVGNAHYAAGRYADAYREYRGLAEVGYTRYLNLVAGMHARGEGVAKDPVESYAWYALSASQGDTDARAALERLRNSLPPAARQKGRALALEYGRLYVAPYRPNWQLD